MRALGACCPSKYAKKTSPPMVWHRSSPQQLRNIPNWSQPAFTSRLIPTSTNWLTLALDNSLGWQRFSATFSRIQWFSVGSDEGRTAARLSGEGFDCSPLGATPGTRVGTVLMDSDQFYAAKWDQIWGNISQLNHWKIWILTTEHVMATTTRLMTNGKNYASSVPSSRQIWLKITCTKTLER